MKQGLRNSIEENGEFVQEGYNIPNKPQMSR